MARFISVCLLLALFLSAANAIPTIQAVGSKFFTSDGHQWFVKGVAYQLIEDDPLVDTKQCERDAALMQQLGVNAIRVYHVNETADHSGCMNAFAAHGIYSFVDLDSFDTYIRFVRDTATFRYTFNISQGTKSSWDETKAAFYRAVMDNFQQYDNLAGFFVGNEVLNVESDSHAAPHLLAAAVDMKKYRDAKGYRKIPIGYSATDTGALRPMLQNYAVCRPDESERMDFYAVNTYSWCGPDTTYNTSGYPQLQELAQGYPVPIWMSEVGCNTVPPRNFKDQDAIFSDPMVDTWSGAMIYEWIQELNHYGLVSYGPAVDPAVQEGKRVVQGFTREGQPTPVQPDFSNLQQVWATITPSSVDMSAYAATMTTKAPECPSFTAGGWSVSPDVPLPTLGVLKVSSGMPTEIPKGSITVSGVSSVATTGPSSGTTTGPSSSTEPDAGAESSSASSANTSESSHSHTGADPTTAEDSPASTTGAAVRQRSNPFNMNVMGFDMTSLLAGLTAAGAVFVLLL